MADVNTYRRCIMPYAWAGQVFAVGDTRAATDAAVVAHPEWWLSLSDADLSAGGDVIVVEG